MTKRNRDTLKNYFKAGDLPSESHFWDLIDSTLNISDDGFFKSDKKGLEIRAIGDSNFLISFLEKDGIDKKNWHIRFDEGGKQLIFSYEDKKNVITLDRCGKIGVNNPDPASALDINGFSSSMGRMGTYQLAEKRKVNPAKMPKPDVGEVAADGKWHPIIENLKGCHAFEIMAAAGLPRTGKYAMIHAIALNTYNPTGFFFNLFKRKNKIRCTQAYYRSYFDKLKLRWTGDIDNYQLELKSNSDYSEGKAGKQLDTESADQVMIRYHISKLWFDSLMGPIKKGEEIPSIG